MSARRKQFGPVAALFVYPRIEYEGAVQNAMSAVGSAAPALFAFMREIEGMPLSALQELYTSTFDLQPSCSLDLGWHLFGEEYERGLLLARIRRELRAHGIAESHELPDHLSHAMLLLARMEDDDADNFVCAVVAPALERMLKAMPPKNLFRLLLESAQQLITLHFPAACEPVCSIAEGATL
jgi:nitrate reductase assembly molybdenum cofactor insertion protein NarJ